MEMTMNRINYTEEELIAMKFNAMTLRVVGIICSLIFLIAIILIYRDELIYELLVTSDDFTFALTITSIIAMFCLLMSQKLFERVKKERKLNEKEKNG